MAITFDPAKRARTLAERGLDFADANLVFAGVTPLKLKTLEETTVRNASSVTACWNGGWLSWVTHRVARIVTSSV